MPPVRYLLIPGLMAAVVALPLAFRRSGEEAAATAGRLVVITPHNDAIREEFRRGFRSYFRHRYGREVEVDYRVPGGTSEIARVLQGAYTNAFRNHWEKDLGRPWTAAVQRAFDDRKFDPAAASPEEAEAREAFLASEVSCGIDVFFGGGFYDFYVQAGAGRLVDGGLLRREPGWFGPGGIPQEQRGETYYDPGGRWVGAALSSFGIVYNRDALARLGVPVPEDWSDLANSNLAGQVAAADPSKSGSIAKAFEMIVQQRMQIRRRELEEGGGAAGGEAEERARREGWAQAMALIQKIAANARYFTDSSTKVSLDVAAGDCAAGMSIDFYGRFQDEVVRRRGGGARFGFVAPPGGTTVSPDPVGVLRGAPHRELAEAFVRYVLSLEGQKLWAFKAGAPGGPENFSLRRMAIRPEIYRDPSFAAALSDPDADPYAGGVARFVYHPGWTGRLFNPLRFIIKVAFIDTHPELKAAWRALAEAGFPPEATARFSDLSRIDLETAEGEIAAVLGARDPVDQVRLAKELTVHFQAQFLEAERLARAGR